MGLTFEGHPERITDFRDAPFCTQLVLVEMLGIDDVTEDTVLDSKPRPSQPPRLAAARHQPPPHPRRTGTGKTVFCQWDYAAE